MTDLATLEADIAAHFGDSDPPDLFRRLSATVEILQTVWGQYRAVMLGGELDRRTKDLMGLSVAIAKSNDYMIRLQQKQLRREGLSEAEELEALAVAGFFEGFDGFALGLRVDSDLRPRRLAAGDMSLIDREIDVNVPYVVNTEDETVNEVYGEIRSRLGIPFIPNIFKALAHQPEMLKAKWECYKAIMGQGQLRRKTKELIAVAVSAVNGCFY